MISYSLKGRRYLFGLHWQPLKGMPGKTQRQEAAQLMRLEKAKFGVVHDAGGSMTLVGAARGTISGSGPLVSGALTLAARDTPCLLIARLANDVYWVCQAGKGNFAYDTDELVDAQAAVERIRFWFQRRQAMNLGPSEMPFYATPDAELQAPGLAQAERLELEQLFGGNPPPNALLQQLGGRSPKERIVLSTAAAAALLLLAKAGWDMRQARLQAAEELRQQQEALQLQVVQDNQREAAIQLAIAHALKQDTQTAAPTALLNACERAANDMGLMVGGWVVDTITCDLMTQRIETSLVARAGVPHAIGNPRSLEQASRALGMELAIGSALNLASLSAPIALEPRPALTDPAALPRWPTWQVETGTALVTRRRTVPGFVALVQDPTPRVITFIDPAATNDPTAPATATVPEERAYREVTLTVDVRRPRDVPIAQLDAPNTRLTKIEIRRGSDGQRRTVATFTVLLGV